MRTGAWHQLGWNHHLHTIGGLLAAKPGGGVILSPRDATLDTAATCSTACRANGASVLLDPQWYEPSFTNSKLDSYPTGGVRASVGTLGGGLDVATLIDGIVAENEQVCSSAVISPAVVYEAGRDDIVNLNDELHDCGLVAAERLSVPCFRSIFLGNSICSSEGLIDEVLSSIDPRGANGWYFGFEFDEPRLPVGPRSVYRCLRALITLRLTGIPVLHAYAGPLGPLSIAAGASAAAAGFDQKQWQFCPARWAETASQGGGGNAPPRFFSSALWGTIVHPDETVQLSSMTRAQVLTPSPFASMPLQSNWSKTQSKQHLVYVVADLVDLVASETSFAAKGTRVRDALRGAIEQHRMIATAGLTLKDNAAVYQPSWLAAFEDFQSLHEDDLYLAELL